MLQDLVAWALPEAVCKAWRSPEMMDVRHMATASPLSSNEEFSAERLWSVAQRAATNAYLASAKRLGLFKGKPGRELLGRLRSGDVHNFRGAMAECVAAWWLAEALRLKVVCRPPGQRKSVLEFRINHAQGIDVEVKSPFRPLRFTPGVTYSKDPAETDHLGATIMCLADAHRQFDPQRRNLVVLVPHLDVPIDRAVLRAFEEMPALAVNAVMIVDTIHDFINPSVRRKRLGEAFVSHRCSVVQNHHRRRLPNTLWPGWPVYEGPSYEWSNNLKPRTGSVRKPWVRVPGVPFEGRMLVFA